MALIKCPECQKEISDKSENCVNCGYPIDTVTTTTTTKDNTEQTNQNNTNKKILECPLEIKENESYTPISPLLHGIALIFTLFLFVAGLFSDGIGAALTMSVLLGGLAFFLSNILYMLTPFYWKKKKNIEIIYDYFKQRFHTIENFDTEKHEKVFEWNEKKKKDNDELMFNIYLQAYNKNADAVILKDLNKSELQCVLIKYK